MKTESSFMTPAYRLTDSKNVFYKKMWVYDYERRQENRFSGETIILRMAESESEDAVIKSCCIGSVNMNNELSIIHTGITETDLLKILEGKKLPVLATCKLLYDEEQRIQHYQVTTVEVFPEWDEFPPSFFVEFRSYLEKNSPLYIANYGRDKTERLINKTINGEIKKMLKDRNIYHSTKSLFMHPWVQKLEAIWELAVAMLHIRRTK